MRSAFVKFVQMPAGLRGVAAIVAACRAGGVGVVNGQLERDTRLIATEVREVAAQIPGHFGVRLDAIDDLLAALLHELAPGKLGWLIVDAGLVVTRSELLGQLRMRGVKLLLETTGRDWPSGVSEEGIDGLILKGHEAGGFVGEDGSFVLLQSWRGRTRLPLYVHGGMTPQVAAACAAVGAAGGVFDSQVLLLEDLGPSDLRAALLAHVAASDTVAVGDGERGEYFRILVRPGHDAARAFVSDGEGTGFEELRSLLCSPDIGQSRLRWDNPPAGLLPLGQDVCFAGRWRRLYRNIAGLFAAIDAAIESSVRTVAMARPLVADAPLAQALGIRLPVLQGPMSRVSDSPEFARCVAEAGGLPFLALALLKGSSLAQLLADTSKALGERPWGINLLGFASQELFAEQLETALRFSPRCAIIAGGRPDQAVRLEQAGISTFLHVPTAQLIPLFMREGARRFIAEGRECGGHLGPLTSFVLWSAMADQLLAELDAHAGQIRPEEVQLVFAGGIHDAISSAMVQVLAAPLIDRGVQVGILMGSAYLFTREIVASGAIVPRFQQEVLRCDRTVSLESGPGHASRCARTPFAQEFLATRQRLREERVSIEDRRTQLDELILGRLRVAAKGCGRTSTDGQLEDLDEANQYAQGMYMLGQVATLRHETTDLAALHYEVSDAATALLTERASGMGHTRIGADKPADVAIIGMACLFPKAKSLREYWDNILDQVDAITEIPRHRWDYRLYYDPDRNSKDKIYAKWGGFLDDVCFEPTQYGMPPRSVKSVDPMQLMALEVAQRTLVDAGYADRVFNRGRASIIIGASGGTGDVGTQYGLRAELPRFTGQLPDEVAARLPEWTEDTFAGILKNVIAGRIANRLDFGGVNFATDAACASSLAAVYQGVSELVGGRSDLVITGGVDTVQGPFGYLCFSRTQALSPTGRCRTFSASADGIVISEGIAMVALKRLSDAERDGDRIYAVIKGMGGGSDGKARGLTAPLPSGQLRAMRRAYQQAGFGPETVGLFEAHGTGTVAGDTAELESTTRLVRESGGLPLQAAIGSVKTLIGHTKASAGVAGLIKAVLSLHHRVLPPHGPVECPNPVLTEADSALYLVDDPLPWIARRDQVRRAAVSAFGFGGTNFHAVLEEYRGEYRPWLRSASAHRWPVELLLWSGADLEAVRADLARVREQLTGQEGGALGGLAAALAARWRAGQETIAMVARNTEDLRAKLGATLASLEGGARDLPAGVYRGSMGAASSPGRVAALFPGQGSQYPGMARELGLYFPICSETLQEAEEFLKDDFEQRFGADHTLSRFLFPRACYDETAKRTAIATLTQTDVAQPALGAVEVAWLRLLQSLGLRPELLAGHSYGEFVAHHAAGAIDFASLLALSAARGRFMVDAAKSSGAELGTMAAVHASREQVEAAVAGIDGVIVANHNAPQQSVVSGTQEAVRALVTKLTKTGINAAELPVAAAFHSPLVMPAKRLLAERIATTPWQPATTPVYSNTTAGPHAVEVDATKRLMADHLVRPVEFVAQIQRMYEDGARIFVELGPKSVLSRLVGRILEGRPHLALAVDQPRGLEGLLHACAQLICAGVDLDVSRLFENRTPPLSDPYRLAERSGASAQAWLLNGSGARPANEPSKQVGITLEQAQAAAQHPASLASLPRAEAALGTPLVTASPSLTSVQTTPHTRLPKEGLMADNDRRHSPQTDCRTAAITGYFDTMRQFLETQERVMALFVGAPLVARAGRTPYAVVPPAAGPGVSPVGPAPVVPPPLPVAASPHHTEAAAVAQASPPPHKVASPQAASPEVTVPTKPAKVSAPGDTPGSRRPGEGGDQVLSDSSKLADLLLGIVEETTGYPRDMVGLKQNLEAELGIDSIKRIQLVGAMLQSLPESYREKLADSRAKLNSQATLEGMLKIITSANGASGTAVPFVETGVGAAAGIGHLPRYIMVAREQAMEADSLRQLENGRFVLTDDGLGVADELTRRLLDQGCSVSRIDREVLTDEAALLRWTQELGSAGKIAGIIHLASLSSSWLELDSALEHWRRELQRNEKSLFLLLRELGTSLAEHGHVLAASALGGWFGRRGVVDAGLSVQGGAPGLLKSYFEERPGLRVKAVDVDLTSGVDAIADHLYQELTLVGGRHEVGYPGGRRTVFQTVAEPVEVSPTAPSELRGLVVLVTGGARGITAELLGELAAGNTLILTGRTPLSGSEPGDLAGLASVEDLRRHFIAQVRGGLLALSLPEMNRTIRAILAAREMRNNIDDLRRRGARVEYHVVDVTDESALGALIDDVQARYGAVNGVVHGAGIIEDKLVADKTSESWSRVVETKVMGLLLLQKALQSRRPKFLVVQSSVAGRYGNRGQADYATANELMNRLCCQLRDRWQGQVKVVSLCWGPWAPTRFGSGMVTAETAAKFAEKGVELVSAPVGCRLFADELCRLGDGPVEVICGRGPWEQHEATVRAIRRQGSTRATATTSTIQEGLEGPRSLSPQAKGPRPGPLLGEASRASQPQGNQTVSLRLDTTHAYLQAHSIDGVPVLPAAAAVEMLAEAGAWLWPGWQVVEVRDCRLLKGVGLRTADCPLQIVVNPPAQGGNEGFDVVAELQSPSAGGPPVTHYRCVLRFESRLPESFVLVSEEHADRTVAMAEAYGQWLFHGPCFQVIEGTSGLSARGARALVRPSNPAEWMRPTAEGQRWLFDPAVLDTAPQMAILWARAYRDETALPVRFGRVVRYRETLPERLDLVFKCLPAKDPNQVRANAYYLDACGRVVILIEELEGVASAALNRLPATRVRPSNPAWSVSA